jgi:sugar transferase EpsL
MILPPPMNRSPNTTFYRRRGKRMLDLALALPALAVIAPVAAATALGVRLMLGSPVVFRQLRPGLHSELFALFKFRTMADARCPEEALRTDAERLSPFGRFLRSTSLDELPELINVVRGEMSLVGPRPLLPQYLDRYSTDQARRHELRPGITGWAQIKGRNALSWDDRLALDVWYVDHLSLSLDLRILAMTAAKVLRRDGISHAGYATMVEFMGPGRERRVPATARAGIGAHEHGAAPVHDD